MLALNVPIQQFLLVAITLILLGPIFVQIASNIWKNLKMLVLFVLHHSFNLMIANFLEIVLLIAFSLVVKDVEFSSVVEFLPELLR